MNSAPRVSVVIPCHNYGGYLREAVESVWNQTLPVYQLLIVDDGSTDDTPEVIRSLGDRVTAIRVEGRGAYGARNDSLAHVDGDFFLNLDADNHLEPTFVEKTLSLLDTSPSSVGYIYTQRQYFGDQDGVSTFPEFSPDSFIRQGYVDMGSLIRMDLVQQFGFDERFNRGQGDRAFFLNLLSAGIQGRLCPEPLLHYRVHDQSITRQVQRRTDQVAIQQELIRAFPDLFPPAVASACLEDARNRLLVSLISHRDSDARLPDRLRALATFFRHGARHAELRRQLEYLLFPQHFRDL